MKRVRIYELMTNDYMHNQYIFGVYKKYEDAKPEILVLKGVMLRQYSNIIACEEISTDILYFKNRFFLFLKIMMDFFSRKFDMKISGCRSQYILFFAVFSWYQRVEIHLHGQFYGSFDSKLKKIFWQTVSSRINLVLSCRFYAGSISLQIDPAIHNISKIAKKHVTDFINKDSKVVGLITGSGRGNWKGYDQAQELIKYGYQLKYYEKAENQENEWMNYLEFLRSINFLFLNPINDYYLYSPSGLISDSINYSKPMLAFPDNKHVHNLINSGCKNIEFLNID